MDLPPGDWEARFEGKGLWSETVTVSRQPSAMPARVRVFPAASLRGRVVLPAGEKPLPELAVRLQPPYGPGQEKDLSIALSCPIQDGKLACEVPAGRFDVRLRAEAGFAPAYFWDFPIPGGKGADLGEIALRRGASVSGWVQTADASPLSRESQIKLAPVSGEPDHWGTQDRLEKTAFEARPDEKGFFQIVGVPPGQYEITVTQPGFAPTRVKPIDVRPELESQVIERLVLDRPAILELALDPPMEPYGHLWRIELVRRSAPSEIGSEIHIGNATAEGIWKSPGIAPGTYEVTVVGDLKSVWHRESVEVRRGQPRLEIRLPVLFVKGTVHLGDEPLAATLWLGDKKGGRIRFDSDERGRFSGVLPGEGEWVPWIDSEEIKTTLEPVEIRAPEGKDEATVDLVVPDTTLTGQVVGEDGRPVSAAQVIVSRLEKRRRGSYLKSGEDGRFTVRGLLPGPVSVNAMQGDDLKSDYVESAIPKEGAGPDLRLVLRRQRTFQGRVVSATGGVPGAVVTAWAPFGSTTTTGMGQSVTGPDGRFEVSLPPDTVLLNLLVMPPGHALRLATVLAPHGQSVEIPVDRQGGTLVLEMAGEGPAPLLVQGGTFTLPELLKPWARLQGVPAGDPTRLTLPNVSAGSYSLCVGAGAITRLKEGAEPPAASCASGVLGSSGELVLKAPAPAPGR
ncbi:MAG TPA: carboxypeptidase-like regulatory domain-containing protein [Thermoanaerobaculia bacterium]